MKIAVIDLGTNTCNLLVAAAEKGTYKILHQSKQHVKLGDSKINSNVVSGEAIERIIRSLDIHKKIIERFQPEKVKLIATSAIRSAENRIELLEIIGEHTGWAAKVITGNQEAELIFKGVLLAFEELKIKTLILDIGGGSNEMILAHRKEMICKESFATGMARIINRFQLSDPLTKEEINRLEEHFLNNHDLFYQECINNHTELLIGCSGAFDTVADIIDQTEPGEKNRVSQEINIDDFHEVYERLIHSSRRQRIKMKGMDKVRVDLIVPAVILIRQILHRLNISRLIQTDFALREGILYNEMELFPDKIS